MPELNRSPQHKRVLKMMIDADISQREIAEHMDVTPQAVHNRMKSGNVQPIVDLIRTLKENGE